MGAQLLLISTPILTLVVALAATPTAYGEGTPPDSARESNPDMFVELKSTDQGSAADKSSSTPSNKPTSQTISPQQKHWRDWLKQDPDFATIEKDGRTTPALIRWEQRAQSDEAAILIYAPEAPPRRNNLLDGLRTFMPSQGSATVAIVAEFINQQGATQEKQSPAIKQSLEDAVGFLREKKYTRIGIVVDPLVSQRLAKEPLPDYSTHVQAWIWLYPQVERYEVAQLGQLPFPTLEISQNQSDQAYRKAIKNPLYRFQHIWGNQYGAAGAALPLSQAIQGFIKKNRYFIPQAPNANSGVPSGAKAFRGRYTGAEETQ